MKKIVKVYDINQQKLVGVYPITSLKKKYDQWRAKGYSVSVDIDGCVCIDNEDNYDDGKYYEEQVNS